MKTKRITLKDLSSKAKVGLNAIAEKIAAMRVKADSKQTEDKRRLQEVLKARAETLESLVQEYPKEIKLNQYHQEQNQKALEENKRMPKMSLQEFIEQSQKMEANRFKPNKMSMEKIEVPSSSGFSFKRFFGVAIILISALNILSYWYLSSTEKRSYKIETKTNDDVYKLKFDYVPELDDLDEYQAHSLRLINVTLAITSIFYILVFNSRGKNERKIDKEIFLLKKQLELEELKIKLNQKVNSSL